MTASLVHVLPDGLLLDGRGGGRVMLGVAVVAFVALALAPRSPSRGRLALLVVGALTGGLLGAWLADGVLTGTLVPIGLSLFGAAIGGPIGAAVAARALHLDVRRALDRLALPGLVAAALARTGCLIAGCDFGRAAPDAIFVVRYAAGTPPFDALVGARELSAHATMTGPLHAFPLYEVALVATGALILFLARRRLAPGVGAALAGAIYFTARALAEGFRHHAPAPSPLVLGAVVCVVFTLGLALRLRSRTDLGAPL